MTAGSSQQARPRRAAWFGLFVVGAACVAAVLRILTPFLSVILLALVAAGIIVPWYRRLVVALHGHRRTAAALVCVVLIVALLVPLSLTAQAVSREALELYELSVTQVSRRGALDVLLDHQVQFDRLNRLLAPLGFQLTPDNVSSYLTTAGVRVGSFFYTQGVSLAKHLVRFVLGFCFWVLILYYLLVDGEALRAWFVRTVPLPVEEQDLLIHRFTDMASSLVVGNGVAAVIQGTFGGALFAALGLPAPVLWGVVMGILAFIPVVGISFVYIPMFVVLLLAGETSKAWMMLVPLMVLATVVEYWLKPLMVGRRAQMHTLLVFLSLIGGMEAFGAVGLLLGPLMMTAFVTIVSIYQERYCVREEEGRY